MNTSKIALYTPSEEYAAFSGSEAIINMFDHTDENSVLLSPNGPVTTTMIMKKRFIDAK